MISVKSIFNCKSKSFNEEFNTLSTFINKQNATDFVKTILSPLYLLDLKTLRKTLRDLSSLQNSKKLKI